MGTVPSVLHIGSDELKVKSILNKVATIVSIVLVAAMSLYTQGYSPSSFTLNPEKKMGKVLKGKEFVQGFSNEEFQIYYAESEQGVKPYSFVKKMGLWIFDYPNINNIRGITKGKDNIYYFGNFALDGIYDFLESPTGERIYGHKREVLGTNRNVFKIPYKVEENITYKFGDDANIMNEKKLFLDGEVVIFKNKEEGDIEIRYSVEEAKENQEVLWTLIMETITSADKSEKIPNGRTYTFEDGDDFVQWVIYLNFDTGHYINVSKDNRFMDWSHNISYHIDLKGQHSDTIYIRIEDYSDFVSPLDKKKEADVYKVTIPEELREYFNEL